MYRYMCVLLVVGVLFSSGCVPKKPPMPDNARSEMTYLMDTELSTPNIIVTPRYVAIPKNDDSWNVYESETLKIVASNIDDPSHHLGAPFIYPENHTSNVFCSGNALIDLTDGTKYSLQNSYAVKGYTAVAVASNAFKASDYIYATRASEIEDSRYIVLQQFDLSGNIVSTLKSIHLPSPTTAGIIFTALIGGTTRSKVGNGSVVVDDIGNVYWSVNTWWTAGDSNYMSELYVFNQGGVLLTQIEYDGTGSGGYINMSRYRKGAILQNTKEYINFKTLMRKAIDYPDNFVKASMHHLFYVDEQGHVYYTDKIYE
jgi:hypothetical protein